MELLGQRRRHRAAAGRRRRRARPAPDAELVDRGLRGRPTSRGFTAGNIALIQRGTCDFEVKAQNAQAAGASARGHLQRGPAGPRRDAAAPGTLGAPDLDIPVVGTTFAIGAELTTRPRAGAVTVHVIDRRRSPRPATTKNVIADYQGRRPDADHRGRRAPRLRARGPRHQRQRLAARPTDLEIADADRQAAASSRASTCASRSGAPRRTACSARPHYVDSLVDAELATDLREPQLRHARVAELRALRLRRRRLGHAGDRRAPPARRRSRRCSTELLRLAGAGDRADRVRRALGLRAVHRRRHPRRRPLHAAPRASRPPSRRPSTAAPPASRTTPATTRPATRSTT